MKHNPYYPDVPDDLYQKYNNEYKMYGGINVTGAAFEEMAGVRDSSGRVTHPDIIKRAHEIVGHYAAALRRAKVESGWVPGILIRCYYCGSLRRYELMSDVVCSHCGGPMREFEVIELDNMFRRTP